MSLKDYIGPNTPKRNWGDEKWSQHAYVQQHNPWISEDDRQYWRDKIKELRK